MTNLVTSKADVAETARAAKAAALSLSVLSVEERNNALLYAADAMEQSEAKILEANRADVVEGHTLLAAGKLSQAIVSRLKLDKNKFRGITEGLRQVAALPDPLGQVTLSRELDQGLHLSRVSCPIGLIAVIFESRPDALPQIAGLCLKSGNAAILKGGRESRGTNRLLYDCIKRGIVRAGLDPNVLVLLESREAVDSLLKADEFVDLIVPRGSNELVKYIQSNTRIPVLGHAEGICHIYVDCKADLEKALKIAIDAKVQYPAACNAAETILVHESVAKQFLPDLTRALQTKNVQVRCDQRALEHLPADLKPTVEPAQDQDWVTEYCDLVVSVKTVESLDEAIHHINTFGSHHTETIVTEDKAAFDRFFGYVNSAGVYWNASTRFADGFRYGFGAEVGISTATLHPRGPVGLEGLVTYKYKLEGNGHVVADYVGDNARSFTHRDLKP